MMSLLSVLELVLNILIASLVQNYCGVYAVTERVKGRRGKQIMPYLLNKAFKA